MSAIQRPRQTAPAVQALGGAVLVQGSAVRDLIYALRRGIELAEGKAIAPPLEWRKHAPRLQAHLAEVARAWDFQMSPVGQGDVANRVGLRELTVGERDWIDTGHAAATAKLSRRQVQRIARQLAEVGSARRVGGAWMLDRVAFSTHLAERTNRTGIDQ